jgi:hypothetical protein
MNKNKGKRRIISYGGILRQQRARFYYADQREYVDSVYIRSVLLGPWGLTRSQLIPRNEFHIEPVSFRRAASQSGDQRNNGQRNY